MATTTETPKYKIYTYKLVPSHPDTQSYYDVEKHQTEYLNEIPQNIIETLKQHHIKTEYIDEAKAIMIVEESEKTPLEITIIVDLEYADISEEEIDEEIREFIHQIEISDGDAIDIFNNFIEVATEIHEPYLDKGVDAYIYNPGGDYRLIRMAVVYKG